MNLIWKHFYLFFLLGLPMKTIGQSIAEEYTIENNSKYVIEEYFNALKNSAQYLNRINDGTSKAERNRILAQLDSKNKQYFSGSNSIFDPRSKVVIECAPDNPKGKDLNSSRKELKSHLRKNIRIAPIFKDFCVVEINWSKKRIKAKFKSSGEIPDRPNTEKCKDSNGYIPRIAYLRFDKKLRVRLKEIGFESKAKNCLIRNNEDLPTEVRLIAPSKNHFSFKNQLPKIKLITNNISSQSEIKILLNGENQKFSFNNPNINLIPNLKVGPNELKVMVNGEIAEEYTFYFKKKDNPHNPELKKPIEPEKVFIPKPVERLSLQIIAPGIKGELKSKVDTKDVNFSASFRGIDKNDRVSVFLDAVEQPNFEVDRRKGLISGYLKLEPQKDPQVFTLKIEIQKGNKIVSKTRKIHYRNPNRQYIQKIDSLTKKIEGLDGDLKREVKLRKRYFKEKTTANALKDKAIRERNNMENERDRLKEDLVALTSDFNDLKKKVSDSKNNLNAQIIALSNNINKIQSANREVRSFVKKYNKWNTMYAGVNYSILNAPYSIPTKSNISLDPISRSLKKPLAESLGFSAYYHVGFFFSNYKNWNSSVPRNHYQLYEVEGVKQDLVRRQIPFRDIVYEETEANMKTYNLGLYIYTQFTPFYLMIGQSRIKGEIWDLYSGDLQNQIDYGKSDMYAIDYTSLNSRDFIFGIAYVNPYFQAEGGYNALFDDYFLSVGLNIPISFKDDPTKKKQVHKFFRPKENYVVDRSYIDANGEYVEKTTVLQSALIVRLKLLQNALQDATKAEEEFESIKKQLSDLANQLNY